MSDNPFQSPDIPDPQEPYGSSTGDQQTARFDYCLWSIESGVRCHGDLWVDLCRDWHCC